MRRSDPVLETVMTACLALFLSALCLLGAYLLMETLRGPLAPRTPPPHARE